MANDAGNSLATSTAVTPTVNQAKASWFFGVVFAIFILCVFIFGPSSLPEYKQQILAYVCASLAGFFGLFFTGALLGNVELPLPGKWAISGGAGFILFLIVLFWWKSPSAPIAALRQGETGRTASSITTSQAVSETIPPIVKAGAPISTKYQYRFTKNNLECVGEYVKVSATEWQEGIASDSPAGCQVDAVVFKYTERESSDPRYFLLYDEGRNLFARLDNTAVGQTSPTDWRLVSSQAWNVAHSVTRIK